MFLEGSSTSGMYSLMSSRKKPFLPDDDRAAGSSWWSCWEMPALWTLPAPATERTFGMTGSSGWAGADSALIFDDSQRSGTKGWKRK